MDDRPALRALILGPPGAGKGTQGTRLAQLFDVAYLSVGELLRQEVCQGTTMGRNIQDRMESGALVPDQVVSGFVLGHLGELGPAAGFVLDGFPRTSAQADTLEHWTATQRAPLDIALWIDVPRRQLIERLISRRDRSGRPDDNEAAQRHRMKTDAEAADELRELYRRIGLLVVVDGIGTIDEVAGRVARLTRERLNSRSDPRGPHER